MHIVDLEFFLVRETFRVDVDLLHLQQRRQAEGQMEAVFVDDDDVLAMEGRKELIQELMVATHQVK